MIHSKRCFVLCFAQTYIYIHIDCDLFRGDYSSFLYLFPSPVGKNMFWYFSANDKKQTSKSKYRCAMAKQKIFKCGFTPPPLVHSYFMTLQTFAMPKKKHVLFLYMFSLHLLININLYFLIFCCYRPFSKQFSVQPFLHPTHHRIKQRGNSGFRATKDTNLSGHCTTR